MTRPTEVIASWFYSHKKADSAGYAQVRGDVSSERFKDVYRRCLAVYFASARSAYPEAELALVTNNLSEAATQVDAWLRRLLREAHVRVLEVPYTHAPPANWPAMWNNQFFVYDALQALCDFYPKPATLVLGDSDMVWLSNDNPLRWYDIRGNELALYPMSYGPDQVVNGSSINQLQVVANDHKLVGTVNAYYGGEYIAGTHTAVSVLLNRVKGIWSEVQAEARLDSPIREEAHLLSVAALDPALTIVDHSSIVKRIWTQVGKHQNASPGDDKLALWHLPAEKRYGLRRVANQIMREPDLAFDVNMWRAEALGAALGVPSNSRVKAARDVAWAARQRLLR